MSTAYVDELAPIAGAEAPAWLAPVRQRAAERFRVLGFPTTKNEDWHFTSVAAIAEADFRPLRDAGGDVKPEDLAPFAFGGEWPAIVFVNGRFSPALSSLDALPDGVRVLDLARAQEAMPDLLERHLTRVVGFEQHAFTALNTAMFEDGAVVHIAREATADVPVHVLAGGRIVKSGGKELALELEEKGYDWLVGAAA